MAADHIDPAPSTAGIFFRGRSSNYIFKSFSIGPPPNLHDPSFFSVNMTRSTICSSSKGLLLCYESDSNTYHIFNPFIHDASISYRLIPDPPRFHTHCPRVVLSVCEQEFYIISAIDIDNRYTFDCYNSSTDQWHSTEGENSMRIWPCRLMDHTGVSNDIGMAFWLTDEYNEIIRFDAVSNSWQRLHLPEELHDSTAVMQLGKINKTNIGLVAMDETTATLYILDIKSDKGRHSWKKYGFLDVNQEGVGCGTLMCIDEPRRLRLLRFDKVVPFLTGDKRITLWELKAENEINCENAILHDLFEWEMLPHPESDMVPYIFNNITPAQFRCEEIGDNYQ